MQANYLLQCRIHPTAFLHREARSSRTATKDANLIPPQDKSEQDYAAYLLRRLAETGWIGRENGRRLCSPPDRLKPAPTSFRLLEQMTCRFGAGAPWETGAGGFVSTRKKIRNKPVFGF
jgi:hypothetical protein